MAKKLFMLGLPGSGKSTVARYIIDYVKRYHDGYSAVRHSDYDILFDMFKSDTTRRNFFPTEHGGFYVKNPSIYDNAIMQLEQDIESHDYADNVLVLVEFARSNYISALDNFNTSFLQDSSFLFLDVDIHTGMKRVKDRVKHPQSVDDHFVGTLTFEYYHQKDNAKYLSSVRQRLLRHYGISSDKIIIHDNRGAQRDFWSPVNKLVDAACPVLI